MADQPRSLREVFEELLPESEVADLAQRIGSQLPAADLRRGICNVVVIALGVAASNPRPWREQKRGLQTVAKQARKAAAAVRELNTTFNDLRWLHSRQELMDALGWSGPDLPALAAQLDNLTLPAKAMADARGVPRHEVFAIFVQLAAPVFTAATGGQPSITYDSYGERYSGSFIELVESVWSKILLIGNDAKLEIEGPRGNLAVGKAAQRLMDKVRPS
jgi:hypothetical protein